MAMLTPTRRRRAGSRARADVLVVDHTADNNLVTFRFKNADVKMLAAEDDFDLGRPQVPRRRRFIIPNADRARSSRSLKDLGLSAWAVAARRVKTHDLDVPRIGYVHSWTRTQDEGWVRAALDTTACRIPTSPIRNCATAICGRSTT
jgi:hypothetical protein